MTAEMNGSTMIASTTEAVRTPIPNGGPWNNLPITGKGPSHSMSHGCTWRCRIGASTNSPQMPKMMLGTAARSSRATPTGRLSHAGDSSVRKMAMPKLIGMAMTIARSEVTSVPYTGARAPYWSVTGFQISRVRKASLKWEKAGQEPLSNVSATPPSKLSTSNAAISVAPRNRLSLNRCLAACRESYATAAVFMISNERGPYGPLRNDCAPEAAADGYTLEDALMV